MCDGVGHLWWWLPLYRRVWCASPLRTPLASTVTAELHVVPSGDLVGHDTADSCCCGPTCEPVQRDDGSIGWLYVHHSIDARENSEPKG